MSKKDWRNFEKRREEALGAPGWGSPSNNHSQGQEGYQNYAFERDLGQPSPYKIGWTDNGQGQYLHQPHGGSRRGSAADPAPGSSAILQQNQFYQKNLGNGYGLPHKGNSISEVSEADEFEGLAKKRKCRDVICLLLFSIFFVSLFVMIGYAWSKENVTKFIEWDNLDDQCNICKNLTTDGQSSNKSISNAIHSLGSKFGDNLSTRINSRLLIELRTGGDPTSAISRLSSSSNESRVSLTCSDLPKCPPNFKTKGNKCIQMKEEFDPTTNALVSKEVFADIRTFYQEVVEDFEHTWKDIIWISLIALGLALVMTILLRFFAGVIIWIVIVGITLFAIGGTVALWILWNQKETNENNNKTMLLVAAIVCSVITVVILVVLISMRKRIALVIRLFKEAGKAVHAMPLLLVQPIWTFLTLVILMGSWLALVIVIESAGNLVSNGGNSIPPCKIEKNWFLVISRWWNLFALFWISQFILGCQDVIIAGAISTWYFTRNKSRLGFPIWRSFYRLMRFHLGSVAFGSLIIAIVKMIRAILNWIQKKLGGSNAFCKAAMCCCQCFVWCLEKFLIFLSRNAYIEIAIYGYGFCKSARKAFKVLVSNALRVAAINSIGDFVLFLAKLAIVAVSIIIGYELLKERYNNDEINHIWAPLLVAAIFAYFIAHCFITVYEMAIDTVFICFAEDCAMNDGVEKPYYMSKGLMEFVKFNRKLAAKSENKK